MIAKLIPIAGFSLIAIFASASFTAGLLDNEQARGHAVDGIKTALGMPYGTGNLSTPTRLQTAQLHPNLTLLTKPQLSGYQLVQAMPQPPKPPQPKEMPQAPGTSKAHKHAADLNDQSACF